MLPCLFCGIFNTTQYSQYSTVLLKIIRKIRLFEAHNYIETVTLIIIIYMSIYLKNVLLL